MDHPHSHLYLSSTGLHGLLITLRLAHELDRRRSNSNPHGNPHGRMGFLCSPYLPAHLGSYRQEYILLLIRFLLSLLQFYPHRHHIYSPPTLQLHVGTFSESIHQSSARPDRLETADKVPGERRNM